MTLKKPYDDCLETASKKFFQSLINKWFYGNNSYYYKILNCVDYRDLPKYKKSLSLHNKIYVVCIQS